MPLSIHSNLSLFHLPFFYSIFQLIVRDLLLFPSYLTQRYWGCMSHRYEMAHNQHLVARIKMEGQTVGVS